MSRVVRGFRTHLRALLVGSLAAALVGLLAAPGRAYDPLSPEVRAMVDKGVNFLTTNQHGGEDKYLGGRCLMALAIYKRDAKYGDGDQAKNHPMVKEAIESVKSFLRTGNGQIEAPQNYSLGIAAIFLLELDADQYRAEIEALLQRISARQRSDGSWSYNGHKTGDTSQTQYAVLAYWAAHHKKFAVSEDAVAGVCNWLLRTQAPNGTWAYQGTDPGVGNYTRVNQTSRVTPSMVVAGLGSIYMSADVLGFIDRKEKAENGQPKVLKKVEEKKEEKGRRQASSKVPAAVLNRSVGDGNRIAASLGTQTNHWQYYYLYGLERYQSFRELAEGTNDPEPGWYNQGVKFLAAKQASDGHWKGAKGSPGINTAFSVLFLLRSTQSSIGVTLNGEGTLRGGMGLPDDLSTLRTNSEGKVVVTKDVASFEEFVDELNSEDFANLDSLLETAKNLNVDTTAPKRKAFVAKLQSMVSGKDYKARLVSVRALARGKDLDHVPALIFALSDPDNRVVREARDGLRFVSRRFTGFGLSDNPTPGEKAQSQEAWKAWYLSIRPDADVEYLK